MKTFSWSQIHNAALSMPAQETGITSSNQVTAESSNIQLNARNPVPRAASIAVKLRKKISESWAGKSHVPNDSNHVVTNKDLFHAVANEFSKGKVDALVRENLIIGSDAHDRSTMPVTSEQIRKIAAFLDAASQLEGMEANQPSVLSITQLQAQARRKLLNSLLHREKLGYGIERIRIHADASFFAKLGIDVDANRGKRELEVIKIPADKARSFIAGKGRMTNPITDGDRSLFDFLSTAVKKVKPQAVVWGNGAFFNMGSTADPTLPEHAPIGETKYANKPAAEDDVLIPLDAYKQYYVTVEHEDGSTASYAPLLSLLGEQQVTKKKLEEPKFYGTEVIPGELTHARRPNPRRANVYPSNKNNQPHIGVINNIYLIAGISHGRGDESNGYTLDEWSSVAAKFDRMNTNRGFAVNADGGSSVMMGVLDPTGAQFKVSTDANGRQVANMDGVGIVENAELPVLGASNKDDLLPIVHGSVYQEVEPYLRNALKSEVANDVAFGFGTNNTSENTFFNDIAIAIVEKFRTNPNLLEQHYMSVWRRAVKNGLAPFLSGSQQAELDTLLAKFPDRPSIDAWIGSTLSIDATNLIDSALKLATENAVLQLTSEEMKSYYRRFTQMFVPSVMPSAGE